MIHAILLAEAEQRVADGADVRTAHGGARPLSNALIGVAGAIVAFGGVFVIARRQSLVATHNGNAANFAFNRFDLAYIVITWLGYLQPAGRSSPARV